MDMITWIQKEIGFFIPQLLRYLDYYNMRDRIPFFATLAYVMRSHSNSRLIPYISAAFPIMALDVGIAATYYLLTNAPVDKLTGFPWHYLAPMQYAAQIIILAIISWKATADVTYSNALAFNGAAATGYVYEIPFWFFTDKIDEAHLFHTSYRYTFLIDYQIIAIPVFIWLLRKQKITLNRKDLAAFTLVIALTTLMASQMYVLETKSIVRLPMIFFSIYLVSKLRSIPTRIKEEATTT